MAFEPRAEVFDDIAPHPEDVDPADELVHERAYVVRAYRKGPDLLVLRGAIRDQKPPGLYIAGDTEPLTVHHMVVDLHVAIPSLEIVDARAVVEIHPHTACPHIQDHYRNVIGLSIARGYTHKVRELFGGPRGCAHTTALLQAMAPVAIQSMWSFRMSADGGSGVGNPLGRAEWRAAAAAANLNTCHVWAEDGEIVRAVRSGEPVETPLWAQRRFERLGVDPASWRSDD
jgi:hypothetical protein